jgi:hypothetical protein
MAHESGQLVPGAVPVAGAGHMRTFAEMSAGGASLASLTGGGGDGLALGVAVGCAHVCTGLPLSDRIHTESG